jgi:3'(2'), 5'-bisphosphate nucleotidase
MMSAFSERDRRELAQALVPISRAASAEILPFYRTVLEVDRKVDRSPVTAADRAADAVIVPALRALTPDIPIVSEERKADDIAGGVFWLVDPLDGTKEFLAHRDEFTVNIGLIEDRQPVLGLVGIPVDDHQYLGWGPGTATLVAGGAAPRPIACRPQPDDGIVVAASRSHASRADLDDFLARFTVRDYIAAGSALKFCRVAEGAVDLYPRFKPTMEWDTAAGHALVLSAGGRMMGLDGGPFLYGKPDFLNPGFIVTGDWPLEL